jgi:murein DD-endopeptidase MepM/ murein hydrolase activator NlpD
MGRHSARGEAAPGDRRPDGGAERVEPRSPRGRRAPVPAGGAERRRWPGLAPLGRRLAIGAAALGVAATVAAGLDLMAPRPRADRFFGPSPVRAGRSASPAAASQHLKRPPAPARPAGPVELRPPVSGRILLGFGWAFSPVFEDWRFHPGVDVAGRRGQKVVAAAAGRVTEARRSRLFGGVVRLDVGDGVVCTYEGLGRIDVRVGETVAAGQPLGRIGPSPAAEASEPPHVHWEVTRDGRPVNPETVSTA